MTVRKGLTISVKDLLQKSSSLADPVDSVVTQGLVDSRPNGDILTKAYPKTQREVLIHALKSGLRSYLLGHGIRSGFLLVLLLFRMLKKRLTLREILAESVFSRDAFNHGLSLGGFSFVWKFVNNSLRLLQGRQSRLSSGLAGGLASFALLALPVESRSALSVQMFLRALQLLYNYHKKRGRIYLKHFDSVLFAITCVPIMHTFIFFPAALPKSYYSFLQKTCGVNAAVLSHFTEIATDRNNLSVTSSFSDTWSAFASLLAGSEQTVAKAAQIGKFYDENAQLIPYVPCAILHPADSSCVFHQMKLFTKVVTSLIPFHVAMNSAPALVLKGGKVLSKPVEFLKRVALQSLRSSAFLATFVIIYKSFLCLHRKSVNPISGNPQSILGNLNVQKAYFILAAIICSGTSILIEKQQRRSELAIYTVPKAIESVMALAVSHNILSRGLIPKSFHTFLGTAGFSVLMGFYQTHPDCMNNFVKTLLDHLIGSV